MKYTFSTRIILSLLLTLFWQGNVFSEELSVEIKITPEAENLPFHVDFEAIITGGSAPYKITWNFGDGSSSTSKKTNHLYRSVGIYEVLLFVICSGQQMKVVSKKIRVSGNTIPRQIDSDSAIFEYYRNNNINCMIEDNYDPNLFWIGTDSGLIKYSKKTGEEKFYNNVMKSVNSLLQLSDGSILFGCTIPSGSTQSLVFKKNSNDECIPQDNINKYFSNIFTFYGEITAVPMTPPWPNLSINSLVQSSNGLIWIGTNGYGLHSYDIKNNKWFFFRNICNAINSIVQSIDTIWIGTMYGLFEISNDYNLKRHQDQFDITSIFCTTEDSMWVGTYWNGLWHFNNHNNIWTKFGSDFFSLVRDSIGDDVNSIVQTENNDLWIGTRNGLLHFSDERKQWNFFNQNNSNLLSNSISNLMILSSGDILIGYGNDKFTIYNSLSNIFYNYHLQENSIPSNFIYYISNSKHDDKIWIYGDNGLYNFSYKNNKYENRSFILDLIQEKKYSQSINCILETNDENTWLGTKKGLIRFNSDFSKSEYYTTSNSNIPSNDITCIEQSYDESIWIGTRDGMARFDYKTCIWDIYKADNSFLLSNKIQDILCTYKNEIWIGTDKGLIRYIYNQNEWFFFNTMNSELITDNIRSIVQDYDGSIWILTKSNDFYYDEQIKLTRFIPQSYDWTFIDIKTIIDTQTMFKELNMNIIQTSDGSLWINTLQEMIKINFPKTSQSPGQLILISGGGAAKQNTIWYTTKRISDLCYRVFSNRNFSNSDIYYMSPVKWADINGDGYDDHVIDCPPDNEDRNLTIEDVKHAITEWAVSSYIPNKPLYIYIIDHGYPDDGKNGPSFLLAPQAPLYASKLNELINTYEEKTSNQVIIINESCYSGEFIEYLKKSGRMVISATDNMIVNYCINGTNSFSDFFLRELYDNKTIGDAFANAVDLIKNHKFTYNQVPKFDDNGDGIYDHKDGVIAYNKRLGGDFVIGAPWPEILTIKYDQISEHAFSFSVTTNIKMKHVWVTVQSPDYKPSFEDNYQHIELEQFHLIDEDDDMLYNGRYYQFNKPGTYILTFYVKDRFNNVDVSLPLEIYIAEKGRGSIESKIDFVMDGFDISLNSSNNNTNLTVCVLETKQKTLVNNDGTFELHGINEGNYTIQLLTSNNWPIYQMENIQVNSRKRTQLPILKVPFTELQKSMFQCLNNNDGKIGLDDVIKTLQMLSGAKPIF